MKSKPAAKPLLVSSPTTTRFLAGGVDTRPAAYEWWCRHRASGEAVVGVLTNNHEIPYWWCGHRPV
ncbi:MAG: hypothetical protein IPP25_12615 [Saprospiraceae bacterium]|nr:hypothetical protein [Candidatus Opimibacter skivensis]